MRRKNNSFREKWTAVIMSLAAALGTGCIILGLSLLPVGEAAGGQPVPRMAELVVNQGLGIGLDGADGTFYPMDMLVADRNIGFFVQIQPEAWQEVGEQPTLLISDPRVSLEDTCPQVTIAHEIGHCLSLGDEYENGTFSVSMNMPPYGMKGKDRYGLSETAEGTSPYILGGTADEWQGSGTVVYGSQYPYDVFPGEVLFRDMTSFMGLSGYQEPEYWVTTQIWEALYRELCEE